MSTDSEPPPLSDLVRPSELWIAVLLVGGAGAAVVVSTIALLHDIFPVLLYGGSLRAFGVLLLVLTAEVGTIGIGLVVMSWLMYRGDAVGWILSIILCGSVGAAELFSSFRSTTDNVAMVVSIGTAALLLSGGIRKFFKADERPVGVISAVILLAFFGFAFGMTGVSMIALTSFSARDGFFGFLLLAGASGLFWLNRRLRSGDLAARKVASLLLGTMSVLVIVVEGRAIGSLLIAVLAGAAIAALWLPESSQRFFAGSAVSWQSPNPYVPNAPGQVWLIKNRSPIGIGAFLLVAAFILFPGLANGGSFGGNNPNLGTSPPSTFLTPTTLVTTSTIGVGRFVRSWNFTATATSGYSESVELQVGNPVQYQSGLANGQDVAGSACTLDQTDALIPFEMTLTNTTTGFDTFVTASFSGIGSTSLPGFPGAELDVEAAYSGGSQCFNSANGDSSFSTNSSVTLSPNGNSVLFGFFVVTNFYSPNFPNGDTSMLDGTVLSVYQTQSYSPTDGSAGINYAINSLTGPGSADLGGTWEFDLAGTSISTQG